ncbi:MAG: dATP pyrophosphohydrolase [Hyphomicrobiales bacterium]|nr:dATP pyrophosphohydrolase [Hyphomicrobiales bacterium]
MRASPIEISEVTAGSDMDEFVRLPSRLYSGEPHYIAPLYQSVRDRLDRRKNPFFRKGEAAFFLARRNGHCVGRISAQFHRPHLERYHDATGHFGFLAAENDLETVSALLRTAESWAAARGITRLTGPFSLTINDESGLLIEGFDTPSTIMMPHDPPYLGGLVEACGYAKVRDLYSYRFGHFGTPPKMLSDIEKRMQDIDGLVIRHFDMRNYQDEATRVFTVFNEAWEENWGFVPLDADDVRHMAAELRPIINPRMAWLAEVNGEPVGTLIMVPDVNQALIGIGPKPSPLGWLRLLYRLKVKGVPVCRVAIAGVSRRFKNRRRRLLIFAALNAAIFRLNRNRFHGTVEVGWMLEDNADILSWMRALGAKKAKTHRVYEKTFAP